MSNAIMTGAHDDELNETFVVYFLPTSVTVTDRLLDKSHGVDYTEGKEYEYKSNREYTWSANQDKAEDDFFFVFRDEQVGYNMLSMDVMLKRRRNKNKNQADSTLVVSYRKFNEEEADCQQEKYARLEKPLPAPMPELDLTAQSLEQSYEEMAQERKSGEEAIEDTIASPVAEEANEESSASSSSASSTSTPASSASSSSEVSSEEEESEEEKEDDSQDD